jgi:5'-3' exonuclease
MGIKGLSSFLKTQYPQIFEPIHISHYHHKKIAIDTSLFMCQFKANYGDEGWLSAFIKLVSLLRENEVHCVFIYDSGHPPEKEIEKKERSDSRRKMEEKVCILEDAIEKYRSTGEIHEILFDFQTKRKIDSPQMLKGNRTINIAAIDFAVKKMRKQLFNITKEDYNVTKKLFDILDIPYFDAPLEAETMCADLCIQGQVDAVLTEDTDVICYGAPIFLSKINTQDGTCLRIKYSDVLENIKLSSDSFMDFCIMCGTDYNKNIHLIGPVKALKLITTHINIETISKQIDVSVLNYIRVRQLFRGYIKSNVKVPYCGSPNFQSLVLFLTKKNIYTNIDSLKKSFLLHSQIVFEEDDEEVEQDEEDVEVEKEDVEVEEEVEEVDE